MPIKIFKDEISDQPVSNSTGCGQQTKLTPQISWDDCKENIKPIAQGRKLDALIKSICLIDSSEERKELVEARKRKFIKDIETINDDLNKRLDAWVEYIDWLEQNIADGGKVNGISNAIEECIEYYYDKKEFKQDKRLLTVFMKFKNFCEEPLEIFQFMYANSLCTLLAKFYTSWSWQYETRKNMKKAGDILKLGMKNLASPRDMLELSEKNLKAKINHLIQSGDMLECSEPSQPSNHRQIQQELNNSGIRAALQSLKFHVNKKTGVAAVGVNRIGAAIDPTSPGGLKSQTEIINGVKVAKKAAQPGAKPRASRVKVATGCPAEKTMRKVPTSQRINNIGHSGKENDAPIQGSLNPRP